MLIATVRAIALGRGLVLLGRYLSVPGVDHDTGLGNAAVRGISGRFRSPPANLFGCLTYA
jgi:hypothetical protein